MMTLEIERAKSVDLVSLADACTELRKVGAREWCGPCPKCGGHDRFHCTVDWFFCRRCHPKRGDVIEFTIWQHGVDFRQAIERLTNAPLPTPTTKRRAEHRRAQTTKPEWNEAQAGVRLGRAQAALLSADGKPGADYLLSRGIEPATWAAFGLGYDPAVSIPGTEGKQKAPAVVLPWIAAGRLRAIRYRFLEVHDGYKQTALFGSTFAGILFAGQTLTRAAEDLLTLVICEGEINALSIWQVAHETGVDVLSLGSESAKLSPKAIEYASRFRRVICWADRYEIAQQLMAVIPGAYGVKSPHGQDANDLLQAGLLGGFLATVRMDAAGASTDELRSLYWTLYDQGDGLDAGAAVVRDHLAPKFDYAA